MASGNTLLTFSSTAGTPPAANAASYGVRAGGSTPAESVPVLAFDAASDEYMDFYGVMPQAYGGGGLTVKIVWTSDTAISDNCIFGLAFRSLEDDAEDVDTSHSYAFNTVTDAAPSAAGEFVYPTITFTDGADMDSVGAGDAFILRLYRDADNASDTMAGDAQVLAVEIRET